MSKSRRTKALEIPQQVKMAVYERDGGCCVWCGKPGQPWCHIVKRSQGGMGIETNIVTLCPDCHRKFDDSTDRPKIMQFICEYMKKQYGDSWNLKDQEYKKWGF